jgi:hypothetical protein
MTDNIRILSAHEVRKLSDYDDKILVYGTFEEIFFDAVIGLGNGNKTPERTEETLNHETIHEVLTLLYGRGLSFSFDRDLYYNFNLCKNGEFCKDTVIRETLIAFFSLTESEILI